MFRAAPRLIARPAARAALPRSIAPAKRYISTAAPTQKSRSWKSLGARIAIAGTLIYYYNTTDVFAEEPIQTFQTLPETDSESETYPTIEAISAERQKRKAVQAQLDAQAQRDAESKQQNAPQGGAGSAEGGIEGLEEEADQQGAFNPETGEINWDCPCLGGMATGPCGEEFKAAFSCFVFSEEEPKGMDCIDKFKDMQNCFRKYPEVYGSELEGDAEDDDDVQVAGDLPAPPSSSSPMPAAATDSTTSAPSTHLQASSSTTKPPTHEREAGRAEKAKQSGESSSKPKIAEKSSSGLALVPDTYKPEAKKEEPVSESESLVPKAAHDASAAGTERLEKK